MNRIFWSCCIVSITIFLMPCSSFSLMHISNSNFGTGIADTDEGVTECYLCHGEGGPGSGYTPCVDCHKNTGQDGEPYRDNNAIAMQTHSSAVMGSEAYGEWGQKCLSCHNGHSAHNGITKTNGVIDDSYVFADLVVNYAVTDSPITQTTFTSIESINVHDPRWADPATWAEKTVPERGLLLVMQYGGEGYYYWWEVIGTTESSITIGNARTVFHTWDEPYSAKLVYGMLIRDQIRLWTGTEYQPILTDIKFSGPSAMAYDESGTGFDSNPDGVCQVCHTQTTHWQSNGSGANHFSGWRCTICHPHEVGFKAVPPPLCRTSNLETPPLAEWDCAGTWGGDAVVDNCGTCDNDPVNDCIQDCAETWGGYANFDACGVCNGSSTDCEGVVRTGTVTVVETGPMWQQAPVGRLTYDDALDYCNGLLFAGYTNWRLPTRDELKGIVVCADSDGTTVKDTPLADGENCGSGYVSPTIDLSVFDCPWDYAHVPYWSSESQAGTSSHDWILFSTGGAGTYSDDLEHASWVRCVRDLLP